ncbi:MAG: PAS domain S-box protein [Anaerolineales bacterium]
MEPPLRLLHLEDDPVDAELLQTRLAFEGLPAEWVRVRTRDDFVAGLQQGDFHLILADYSLPAFDGLSALALAQDIRPSVPFIMVSGVLGEERAVETLKRGATDYVLKTRLDRLAPAVRRALREAEERAERQRAEAALHAEREWLRVTLASIGDAVIATDTRGQVTFMNAVAEALTGWTQTEAIGRPGGEVFRIINEHSRAEVDSPVTSVLREGRIAGLANHTLLITKDGQEIPIDDSGAPIHDTHGQLIGVVLVFRDIRERRQAEDALRNSEQRYRSLTEATTSVVWTTDARGDFTSHQPSWEAYTGQPWPEHARDGWAQMLHPEDRARVQADWERAVTERSLYESDGRLWHAASEQYRYFVVRAVPLSNEHGAVREWIGTITDIHERKQARLDAERAAERTARLHALTAALSSALTPLEVADVILNQGRLALGADAGALLLLTQDRSALEVVHSVGFPEAGIARQFPLTAPFPAAEAVRTGEPIWIDSFSASAARYPQIAKKRGETGYEAVAYIPLITDRQAIGSLIVSFAAARQFSVEDQAFLLTLARQCAQALERARLYEAERRARAETQTLNQELEQRVKDRTQALQVAILDLEQTNAALHREVEERQRAEEQIRERERQLAEAQHVAHLGSWHWNIASNTITWTDELYRIYGLDPQTFTATYEGFLEQVHPDDRAFVNENITRAFRDRQPFTFFHRIVRPDEVVCTLQARGDVIVNEAGQLVAMSGTGQDVTEIKQIEEDLRKSQEQLRQLSDYLQAVREEERTRIAREIHDELGGAMTGLKMDVASIRKVLTSEQTLLLEKTGQLLRDIDTSVQTVRRIAMDLRPHVLDDFGLPAAIEWQLQEFQRRAGIQCQLASNVEELSLDSSHASAVFRVFQEALTNVARHAQATLVQVRLEKQPDSLILQVIDNGRGISEPELAGARSLGLLGMHERVRMLSGELNIHGARGQGTTVYVKIPLQSTQLESATPQAAQP